MLSLAESTTSTVILVPSVSVTKGALLKTGVVHGIGLLGSVSGISISAVNEIQRYKNRWHLGEYLNMENKVVLRIDWARKSKIV